MALPTNDTFTEASATNLQDHTSDSGHSWTASERNMDVGAGTGFLTATAHTQAALIASPASADYWFEGVGRTVGTTSADRCGVFIRYDGGAQDAAIGYQFRVFGDTGNWRLDYRDGTSTETLIDSGTIGSFSASTDYTFRVEGIGDQIQVFIDGVGQGANTDSNITGAGNPGLYLRGSARFTSCQSSTPASSGIVPQVMHHRRMQQQ